MVSVEAADVNRYYDEEIYPASSGYVRTSSASMGMNCHGFSTGLNYWLDSFDKLMNDEYTLYSSPLDLAAGAIRGDNTHSIKITKIEVKTYGEKPYRVIETQEKFRSSGVYKKSISDEEYESTDTVSPSFYKKN
jgi:hypothetical protein